MIKTKEITVLERVSIKNEQIASDIRSTLHKKKVISFNIMGSPGGGKTTLIEKTIEHAKAIGLEKVELEVFESNKIAIGFYNKYGFKEEGLLIKSRKLDGKYDNVVVMGYFL